MFADKSLYELLNDVSFFSFCISLTIIILLLTFIRKYQEKAYSFFLRVKQKRDFAQNVSEMLSVLTHEHSLFKEELLKSTDERKVLNTRIDELQNIVNDLKESNKKSTRASIKDRIRYIYYRCNTTQKITDMEWDTLNDLITDYEDNDGTNSFIHSKVALEMYDWERVSDDYYNEIKK